MGEAAEASVSNKPRISQAVEEVPGGSEGPALRADGARPWCGAGAGCGGEQALVSGGCFLALARRRAKE